MFKDKSVFILGAGSNFDYKFPTGEQLVNNIVGLLREPLKPSINNDDEKFKIYISEKFKSIKDDVAQDLALSMDGADTVDEYIAIHKDNKELVNLVKQCLVYVILSAEQRSILFKDSELSNFSLDYNKSNSFYNKFWKALRSYTDTNSLTDALQRVSVITFNYDRSFEHFLVTRLAKTYRIEKEAASDFLRKSLKIIHVYGHLRVSHDMTFIGDLNNLEFGAKSNDYIDKIGLIAQSIDTIGKENNKGNPKPYYKRIIEDSQYLYSVGFGYNSTNLSLIFPTSEEKISGGVKKQFKGTLKIGNEISYKTEHGRICQQLARLLKPFDNSVASGRELIERIGRNLPNISGAEFMDRYYYDMIESD